MSEKDSKQKEFDFEGAVERGVKAALEIALPLAARVTADAQRQSQPVPFQKTVSTGERCPECQQMKFYSQSKPTGAFACDSKHKKVVIYPSFNAKWFQGAIINGVTYRSSYPGQLVTVPEDSEVEHIVASWEKQEREYANGRERNVSNELVKAI